MVHHGLTAITSLFLLISLCSSSAEAYALRKAPAGQVLVWSQRAVTVELDGRQLPGAPGAADAVRAAFATWSSAGAPVAVTLQESKTIADGSQDGKNTIRFEHKRWDYGHEVIGLTLATYYAQSGLVFETDIVFDAVNRQWSTSANTPSKHFDVQNIAAHEAGHFFGLGHSQHTDATMFAESLPGERDKRTLSPDDRAGLAAIVAEMDRRIGAKAQLPPPKADQVVEREVYSPLPARTQIGCNVSGAETHAPISLLLVLALFVVLRGRRRGTIHPNRRCCQVASPTPDARKVAFWFALVVAMTLPQASRATIVRALPLQTLLTRADTIVEATVVNTRAHRVEGRIVTDYTLAPTRCWRGRCERLVLQTLGGVVGEIGLHVSGALRLRRGQRILLLGRQRGAVLHCIGLAQSAFLLEAGRATRDLRGLMLLGVAGKTHPGVQQSIPITTLDRILKVHVGKPRLPGATSP